MGNAASGEANPKVTYALTVTLWVLFALLFAIILAMIIVFLTTSIATIHLTESMYSFPDTTTIRHSNKSVNLYAKLRFKGGSKESELPNQDEIKAHLIKDLQTISSEVPEGTSWNIIMQLAGERIMDNVSVVAAVSVELQTIETNPVYAIYTKGSIVPLTIP